MTQTKILFPFLLLLAFYANGKTPTHPDPPRWSLRLSIMDESISLPNAWFVRYGINPALMVGGEYLWKQKGRHEWLLGGNLGGFHHPQWQNSVFVNAEFGYRYRWGRFSLSPKIGMGYAHNFSSSPVYGVRDGELQEVANLGSPSFMPSLSLSMAYSLGKQGHSPEIFLIMMQSLELPYSLEHLTHQFVGLGLQLYPFSKK